MDFLWPQIPVWELIVRALAVFAFLIVLIRITGKRDVGEMSPSDLILLLLVSATVHTSLVGDDTSLFGGMIGAATLILANQLLNRAACSSKKFEKLLKGKPEIVISKGEVCSDVLKRHRMTRSQLKSAIRKEGLYRYSDIRLAVLEPDGIITVIKA